MTKVQMGSVGWSRTFNKPSKLKIVAFSKLPSNNLCLSKQQKILIKINCPIVQLSNCPKDNNSKHSIFVVLS